MEIQKEENCDETPPFREKKREWPRGKKGLPRKNFTAKKVCLNHSRNDAPNKMGH